MNARYALTLIELLLALAIMATVASLVLPNLLGMQHQMQFRAQTAELADQLRSARQLAVDQGSSSYFSFANGQSTYWLSSSEDPSHRQQRQLPEGLTLNASGLRPGSALDIVFAPDGSAMDYAIEVRSSRGSMWLRIERLTGSVTLGDMP